MHQFFKNVIWLQAGSICLRILSFLLFLFTFKEMNLHTKNLELDISSLQGFGLYSFLYLIFTSVGIFMLWDPGRALVFQIAQLKEGKGFKSLAIEGWSYALLMALAYSLVLFLFSYTADFFLAKEYLEVNLDLVKAFHFREALPLLAVLPLVQFPMQWAINLFHAKEKMKQVSLLSLLHNLARPLGAVVAILLISGIRLDLILMSVIAFHCLNLLVMLVLVSLHFKGLLSGLVKTPFVKPRPELIKQGFLISCDKKTFSWLSLLPKQFLVISTPIELLAIYEVVMKLNDVLAQFLGSVSSVLLPRLTSVKEREGWSGIRIRVRQMVKHGYWMGTCGLVVLAIVSWFLFFPLSEMKEADHFVAGKIGLLTLVIFPFFGYAVVLSPLMIIQDKIYYFLKIKILVFIVLGSLAYYLINEYQLFGAALFFVFNHLFATFFYFDVLMKDLNEKIKQEGQ